MTTKTIITLGRQFGSGGRAVGKKLAEDLGIPYYDKEILSTFVSEESVALAVSEEVLFIDDSKDSQSALFSLYV